MFRINVSDNFESDYISQRKNAIRPLITCNVTSECMALLYAGYSLPLPSPMPEGWDDADVLENFMLTDERVSEYYKQIDPAEWQKWQDNKDNPKVCTPPNEYHKVLSYGVNLWLGDDVDTFTTDASMKDVIAQFVNGRAAVHSGLWDGFHHIICSVGVITAQDLSQISSREDIDLSQVESIIVDDPYGNYATKYQDPNGNDVVVPYKDFISFTNTLGSETAKVVHFIK